MLGQVWKKYAFMPLSESDIQKEAKNILDAIAFTPFEECQPLSRDFNNIPDRPGIYAIRHKYEGLLYIGKTKIIGVSSPYPALLCTHKSPRTKVLGSKLKSVETD